MNPAFSVVLLTTLIGAGQGLFLVLFAAELSGRALPGDARFLAFGGGVAFVLTALGLLASTFHLGRPERGWRAAARWRTSWLSREVIVLPLFLAGCAVWAAAHGLGTGGTLAIGALTAAASLALYLCTAMVYASIRFLQEWATPLTIVNYTVLGLASGATLGATLAAFGAPSLAVPFAVTAIAATSLGFVTRSASLVRNARLKPRSTLQSAIGIRHPVIRQRAMGFMGGSFNTREFFHGRAPALLRQLKWAFLAGAFVLPLALLATGLANGSAALFAVAFVVQYVGLLAERWIFFAQANHPQNLYYQVVS